LTPQGGGFAAFFCNLNMPQFIHVQNLNRRIEQPARVGYCDSFLCRLRGLMFRPLLSPEEGLLLVEKRDSRLDTSIHMFFVSFDLAVVWINSDLTVVDKVIAKSWKPAYFPKADAKYTLEIHPTRWADYEIGDKVEFKDA
jgi:uncharacterized membrane protein (UPF0127 family)